MNGDKTPGAESPNLRGMRVLLVEDSWQLGMALKSLLRSFDAEVDGPVATTADAERMAKGIAGAELVVIPDAGHLSNLEQPDRFTAAVERFAERLVLSRR